MTPCVVSVPSKETPNAWAAGLWQVFAHESPILCLKAAVTRVSAMRADGGFYSDQAEAIIYNPVNGTGPGTGSTGPPADTNKVVAFTVKLTAFDHAAFYQKNPNTGLTAAQLYTFNLDSYLQANLNPLAYSLITGDSPGSLNVQTAAYIPFAASNPASSASAASAVTNLQATLTSSSALGSIFDPSTFGTASVDPSSVTVSSEALPFWFALAVEVMAR